MPDMVARGVRIWAMVGKERSDRGGSVPRMSGMAGHHGYGWRNVKSSEGAQQYRGVMNEAAMSDWRTCMPKTANEAYRGVMMATNSTAYASLGAGRKTWKQTCYKRRRSGRAVSGG